MRIQDAVRQTRSATPDGTILVSYKITSGRFRCRTCLKQFNPGDTVLPVFWNHEVSNYVCTKDRGILEEEI